MLPIWAPSQRRVIKSTINSSNLNKRQKLHEYTW